MDAPPSDDTTTTVPTAYLAALERLYAAVEREPIGRVRRQTTEAWEAVRRLRATRRRGRRKGDAK